MHCTFLVKSAGIMGGVLSVSQALFGQKVQG